MIPITIAEEDFQDMITERARSLLSMTSYISQHQLTNKTLTRPFLSKLLSQSIQMEELLDAYGAQNNRKWYPFRSLIAAIKLFSDVSYELLHIQHVFPIYHLLPIEQDFIKATEKTLAFTGDVLLQGATRIVDQAHQLGLTIPRDKQRKWTYAERLPPGLLPPDRGARRTENACEIVTLLATAFLNLSTESELVHFASRIQPKEYASCIVDTLSEEKLRSLQLQFHNLQLLYDTYVLETEVENLDTDLPVLRSHISVIFHLLKTATAFAHYYERHIKSKAGDSHASQEPIVNNEALLATLMEYSITYASYYLTRAHELCQTMLKRYAEIGQIEVSVPPYRGFHVRPSTLISKIVFHYGSDVQMKLGGERYDASSPLELFRANEEINAQKRRWLNEEIVGTQLVSKEAGEKDIEAIIRIVILTLAEQGKLILYEQPLQLSGELAYKEGTPLEQVIDEIARLQATGKIDIETDLKVTFVGDKRVLSDIELLAESGYGEDNFGNNIHLPGKLTYLRK